MVGFRILDEADGHLLLAYRLNYGIKSPYFALYFFFRGFPRENFNSLLGAARSLDNGGSGWRITYRRFQGSFVIGLALGLKNIFTMQLTLPPGENTARAYQRSRFLFFLRVGILQGMG